MNPTSQPTLDPTTLYHQLTQRGSEWGAMILAALLVMILGWIISRLITATIRRLMTRARVEPSIVGFTANLLYFAMMAFVIIAALQKLGLQTNSLVAAIGAAGLAVVFALPGSLSN